MTHGCGDGTEHFAADDFGQTVCWGGYGDGSERCVADDWPNCVLVVVVIERSAVLQMPFEGLNLDLGVKMTRGRVQDLRIYLHNRLKKVHLLH